MAYTYFEFKFIYFYKIDNIFIYIRDLLIKNLYRECLEEKKLKLESEQQKLLKNTE